MCIRDRLNTKGHFGDVPQANLLAWCGKTKPNITKARIHQSEETTQNKHKKTKARFSRLLRHLAWKRRGSTLVSALHKLDTYLLTYLDTYPFTYSPGTHTRQTPRVPYLTTQSHMTHENNQMLCHFFADMLAR